jgi:putative peptidoglycan lipid II flippase
MFSLACYIVVTVVLLPVCGFLSLMIADSVKQVVHMVVSLILLRRRIGSMGSQQLPVTLVKVTLATLVMGLVTYALTRSIAELLPPQGLRERLLLVVVPALLGGLTYFILASLLHLNEFTLFVQALTRRIRKRPAH